MKRIEIGGDYSMAIFFIQTIFEQGEKKHQIPVPYHFFFANRPIVVVKLSTVMLLFACKKNYFVDDLSKKIFPIFEQVNFRIIKFAQEST